MATAKVISHSFDIERAGVEGGIVKSPDSLILAKIDKKEIRVSIPVTRQGKPAVGSDIEITEPVEQYKPRYNSAGVPIPGTTVYSANLLSKTAAALLPRKDGKHETHDKK